MASTKFIPNSGSINADWLNDVNDITYSFTTTKTGEIIDAVDLNIELINLNGVVTTDKPQSSLVNSFLRKDYAEDVFPSSLAGTQGSSGTDRIANMVSLTQAEYDAIVSPLASTMYVIKG